MPRRKKQPSPPKRRRRGSGSISTAADGTIRARVPAAVDPRRPAREFRAGEMALAVAWLEAQVNPQPVSAPTTTTITLGDWAAYWLATYVEPFSPPNTVRWARYALAQLAPLDAVPLVDVRQSALQERVGQLRVAAPTVQGVVGYWRRCLDAAVYDELLTRNPAARLIAPKAAPREARRFVTPAEARLLLAAIRGHRFEAAYALLIGCGLRIGEVLGLRWEHVDLAAGRAWIQWQWTNSHWRDLPKGRRPRSVSLPPAVVAALIRHRDAQPEGSVLVMQSPIKQQGRPRPDRKSGPWPWSRKAVAEDLSKLVAELGLPALTTHAARRGLSSALLDGRVPPAVVADRLGHISPATTLEFYSELGEEAVEQASRLIDAYLGDAGPEDDSGAVS